MAPAKSKKRRRADTVAEPEPEPEAVAIVDPPILFKSPGLKPDVRLKLFAVKEVHCHSVILKLHSNYFRKFLDSPDKSSAAASAQFQYEYVTVIDRDGTWALEPAAKAPTLTKEVLLRMPNRLAVAKTQSFICLLRAMYNRPYVVRDVNHLVDITNVADFYCALPILSATLTRGLLSSPIFNRARDNFSEFALSTKYLIFTAKQLRHGPLFRDCLIHLAGQWPDDEWTGGLDGPISEDESILALVTREHNKINEKIMLVDRLLLKQTLRPSPYSPFANFCFGDLADIIDVDSAKCRPRFYHVLKRHVESPIMDGDRSLDSLRDALNSLLANNLVLDQIVDGSREKYFEDSFLCATIEDSDLPWERSQIDW